MSTKKLTTSAILIALAFVLCFVSKLIPALWAQGGSITIASMVPICLIGILFGNKWGIISALAYALLQMLTGFYPPPTQDFLSFFLVVLLDYILAFGVLGLSGFFYKALGSSNLSFALSGTITAFLRYICHIVSGILIWGVYAENGQSVFVYSLIYNGSYMVPEIIITTIVLGLIKKPVLKLNKV